MSRHRDWDIACKVYIGNLGNNASKYEIEDAFSKYGPLRNVWVARNPPGFAFVEFEEDKALCRITIAINPPLHAWHRGVQSIEGGEM